MAVARADSANFRSFSGDVRPPSKALFLAGKVFVQYRKSGGARTGVLPDFFYRRSCRGERVATADARQRTVSNLFPEHGADRAGKMSNLCESLSNYNFNPLEH